MAYPALRRVVAHGRLLEAPQGQLIIGPELGPPSVYVVLDGSVSVTMPWGPVLDHLGPGELFGETALLRGAEREAYWKAEVDSLLFEIPFNSFHADLMTSSVTRAGLQERSLVWQRTQAQLWRDATADEEEGVEQADAEVVDGDGAESDGGSPVADAAQHEPPAPASGTGKET